MAFRLLPEGRRIAGNRDAPFANGGVRREDCRRENESFMPFDWERAL